MATKDALTPLASDLIMSARSIQSFRHLEYQNLSISSDFIGRNSWRTNLLRSSSPKRISKGLDNQNIKVKGLYIHILLKKS